MDPNQNDQANQTPQMPADDGSTGQNPMATPQPEPATEPTPEPISMPEPTATPEPTPSPAPASDVPQGQVEEITPPPPMVEEHPQDEQPAGTNQGSAGDTNPLA